MRPVSIRWSGAACRGALLAALLAAAVIPAGAALGQGQPMAVGVDPVRSQKLDQTSAVIGRFVAPQSGIVAARIAERVTAMPARVGDRVAAGQTVVRLADDRLRSQRQLAAAEVERVRAKRDRQTASLKKSRQALARISKLRGSTAFRADRQEDAERDVEMAGHALSEAEADLRRAEATLDLADTALRDAEVAAPYAGVVTARHTVIGSYVRTGDPLVSLLNDRELEIEAEVPAARVGGLVPGTRVTAELADGLRLSAVVRAVVPEENQRTRTRAVRFRPQIGEERFAANQSVTVWIPIGRPRDVVTVAKDAVVVNGGRRIVYVVEDGVAAVRPVRTGEAIGNRFEVRAGLKPGEIVVVRGNERLRPGQPVKPKT